MHQPNMGLAINPKIGPAREMGLTLPWYLGSSHKKSNRIVCNGGKRRRRSAVPPPIASITLDYSSLIWSNSKQQDNSTPRQDKPSEDTSTRLSTSVKLQAQPKPTQDKPRQDKFQASSETIPPLAAPKSPYRPPSKY